MEEFFSRTRTYFAARADDFPDELLEIVENEERRGGTFCIDNSGQGGSTVITGIVEVERDVFWKIQYARFGPSYEDATDFYFFKVLPRTRIIRTDLSGCSSDYEVDQFWQPV